MNEVMHAVHDCAECGAGNAIWVDWAYMPLCPRCEAIIDEELEEQATIDRMREEWEHAYDTAMEDRYDDERLER